MTLGSRLKTARMAMRQTLRKVEERTSISNGYLSQLESDAIRTPSPRHLYALAQLYQIEYGELMDLAGYVVPDVRSSTPKVDGLVFDAGYLTADEEEKVLQYADLLRTARNATQRNALAPAPDAEAKSSGVPERVRRTR